MEDAAQHFHAGPHLEQTHAAKQVPALTRWDSTSGRVTCHPDAHVRGRVRSVGAGQVELESNW